MEDQPLGQSEVGAQAAEKTPEQMKQELVEAILEKDQNLEGFLVTQIRMGDRGVGFILNAFPFNGSEVEMCAAVSQKDGPLLFSKRLSKIIAGNRTGSDDISRAVEMNMSEVQPATEGSLRYWEDTFAVAEKSAARKVEKTRTERQVLPKALEFVKSSRITASTAAPAPQ